jgi:hypothetical protein
LTEGLRDAEAREKWSGMCRSSGRKRERKTNRLKRGTKRYKLGGARCRTVSVHMIRVHTNTYLTKINDDFRNHL